MPWISGAIGAGAGLLGSIMGGNSAADAARAQAKAQTEAAKIAAEAARFRPVGVTSRFGSSQFTTDDKGYVSGAGYNVAPDVAAMRDRLLGQAGGQGFQTAEQAQQAQQSLFGLGQQYMAQSPEAAAQQWMQSQQALLQPGREQSQALLNQNLFNTGRGGLAVSQGGSMGAANPEQQALLNAQMMQDLTLASQAQQQGRAQTQFGAGLFGTGLDIGTAGYNPLKTQFGLAQGMEAAGAGTLATGSELGGRSSAAGANMMQPLYQGGMAAAATQAKADAYSPWSTAISGLAKNPQLMQGLGNWLGGTPNGVNSMGNPIYNPANQTGGWTGTSLAGFFGGTGGAGD